MKIKPKNVLREKVKVHNLKQPWPVDTEHCSWAVCLIMCLDILFVGFFVVGGIQLAHKLSHTFNQIRQSTHPPIWSWAVSPSDGKESNVLDFSLSHFHFLSFIPSTHWHNTSCPCGQTKILTPQIPHSSKKLNTVTSATLSSSYSLELLLSISLSVSGDWPFSVRL